MSLVAKDRLQRKSRALLVRESAIEQTCTEILEWDGWRSFKMEQNFSEKKQKLTGEAGMADRLYIRYSPIHNPGWRDLRCEVQADVMWIEWKSLSGHTSPEQQLWILAERKRGALVLCAGINFPASIEGFRQWYAKSGLQRR